MDAAQLQSLLQAIATAIQGNANNQSEKEVVQLETFYEENESWDIFIKRLENFFSLKKFTGTVEEIQARKRDWLIHAIGAKTLQLLSNLTSPDDPKTKSYEQLVRLVKDHLHPAPSVIAEQNRFTKRIQHEGESIANFVADLKKLCRNCDFKCGSCQASTADAHLRQQFISGLRNVHWLEKLIQLKEPNNAFTDCVTATLAMESAQKDSKEIQNLQATSTLMNQNQLANAGQKKSNIHPSTNTPKQRQQMGYTSGKQGSTRCFRCGEKEHLANVCKHVRTECAKCRKMGHLARVCMSSSRYQQQSYGKTTSQNQLQPIPSQSDEEEVYYINHLSETVLPEEKNKPKKFMLELVLDGVTKQLELDTGAAVSSISHEDFISTWPKKQIHRSAVPFRTYTGEVIHPIGYATMQVKYGAEETDANIYVMPGKVDAVFGREWLKLFKVQLPELHQLHTKVSPILKEEALRAIKTKFADVFRSGVGKINDYEATLFVNDNTKPIYIAARKVPYATHDKMEKEIDRLESAGIITKVQYSDWGTPVVPIVKKNGSIRLCADYKITLNKVLKNSHYPIPPVEDIFATTMLGGKIFTTLDLSEAYLHMPMDEQSAKMQAISTIKGDYKVNRLMYGTKVAPAIWQNYITQRLRNIPGVCVFLDNIKVQGKHFEEHLTRVEEVLRRLNEVGLRVNFKKCKFFESSITYLGHVISERGLEKTKDKIQAIMEAPTPTNVTEVRSWLGLVNYYGRFLQNLSAKLHPLYKLLQKDVLFKWTKDWDAAFNLIKTEITSDIVLVAYDPKLPLSLATDASPYGLGAVLSHTLPDGQERPIAYASRSLSASERNYSQIDKEATAIFWALKRFFCYCYGRKFSLITDHKPLVAIFSPDKQLPSMVATRMLHYAQFLQGFNYNIVYRATGDHANVDALSRLPLKENNSMDMDDVTRYQMLQMDTVPVTQKHIAMETSRDSVLKEVYNQLIMGQKLREPGYEGKDEQFSLSNGTILKNSRVVIPESLRKFILAELHTAHVGIVKMKALARSYVWWPGIDSDIENLARECFPCRSVLKQAAKKVHHPWEYPSTPWQRVHVDFAGPFMDKYFFIAVDAHSKWPEIVQMTGMMASKTIEVLRDMFSRYGLPLTLVTDNGPTFTSWEFKQFIKANGIHHKFTAPYHPSTNGQAERAVQNMKVALRKMVNDNGNLTFKLSNFLMRYRKTPNATTGVAPCVLFLQRDIRIVLDLVRSNYGDNVREKLSGTYPSGTQYYPGDLVQVRNYASKDKKWEFGKIVRRDGLLHYFINVHGRLWRRHSDQIMNCNINPMDVTQDPDVEVIPQFPSLQPKSILPATTEMTSTEPATDANQIPEPMEGTVSKQDSSSGGGAQHIPTLRRSTRVKKPVDRFTYA